MIIRNLIIAFTTMAGIANLAYAHDVDRGMPKLSGFATLGISHSSEHRGDYVLDGTVPKGAGLSHDWAFGNDSRVGAQISAGLTSSVSAVLQVISEYQHDSTYRPAVEWANIKYSFTPDFYIRAGRIALPTFLNSDTRKVGYSYPWIHPPTDIYRQLAITNSDGIDTMFRFDIGVATNAVRAIYGRNEIDRATSTSTSRGLWGVFDTVEQGPTTLHVGYQERETSTYSNSTGLTGPWTWNRDESLGANYDPGNWFITSEWIKRESSYKKIAWFVSAGLRIGNFTPYFNYGRDSAPSYSSTPTASSVRLATRSQNTTSIGTRYDFKRNADFKLQYDLIRTSDDSNGYLTNVPTGITLHGDRFHVFSAVFDFLF